jgi:hypothetical protein
VGWVWVQVGFSFFGVELYRVTVDIELYLYALKVTDILCQIGLVLDETISPHIGRNIYALHNTSVCQIGLVLDGTISPHIGPYLYLYALQARDISWYQMALDLNGTM